MSATDVEIDAYLGLGTNLGDRLEMLRRALSGISQFGDVFACSSVYETEPWGDPNQGRFLNLCCGMRTEYSPQRLHASLKTLEQDLGRTVGRRWGPRLIDVDLLAYDGLELDTPELTIPHPRIGGRAFVLAPLAEIAAELVLPGQALTVRALLRQLPDADSQVWIYALASEVAPAHGAGGLGSSPDSRTRR